MRRPYIDATWTGPRGVHNSLVLLMTAYTLHGQRGLPERVRPGSIISRRSPQRHGASRRPLSQCMLPAAARSEDSQVWKCNSLMRSYCMGHQYRNLLFSFFRIRLSVGHSIIDFVDFFLFLRFPYGLPPSPPIALFYWTLLLWCPTFADRGHPRLAGRIFQPRKAGLRKTRAIHISRADSNCLGVAERQITVQHTRNCPSCRTHEHVVRHDVGLRDERPTDDAGLIYRRLGHRVCRGGPGAVSRSTPPQPQTDSQ